MQQDQIISYLSSIGLNPKESLVYLTLYTYGTKPASTIASISNNERVWTYKTLCKLVDMGIIAETMKQSVKHFWVPSLDLIKSYVTRKQEEREKLDNDFDLFRSQISQLDKNPIHSPPKIQLYEKNAGIKSLCTDILQSIKDQGIITIKLFATNTFDTQMQSSHSSQSLLSGFFKILDNQKIALTSYIAQGSLIMEHLSILEKQSDILNNLPAGGNAINLFVIGKEVFLIIYKDEPIGIRFASPEFAWAMHFLLENNEKD